MKIKYKILSLIVSISVFYACKKDNYLPNLDIEIKVNNLEVTVSGHIMSKKDDIKNVEINWGDNKVNSYSSDFDNISKSHTYKYAGDYKIFINVTDLENNQVSDSFNVTAKYSEISLTGVDNSLLTKNIDEYTILTFNLHTYQEDNQIEKFHKIAQTISELDIDFVCFQECGQNKSQSIEYEGIRIDNAALVITNFLKNDFNKDYNFAWTWAHIGFDDYEEGVAVLSKYQITENDQKYISSNQNTSSIESRKIIYANVELPDNLIFNVFSTHTHWRKSETDNEQNNQINNIKNFVAEKEQLFENKKVVSIVSGDFNVNPTSSHPWSEGYNNMVFNNTYVDSYLFVNKDANTIPANSQHFTVWGSFPGRIDYIFIKNNSNFEILNSQIIFKPDIIGKFSDHNGVITKLKIK